MTVTTTSVLSNSVATAYNKEYLEAFLNQRILFDLIDWGEPIGGNLRGSTISQPVLEEMAVASSALTEGTDVTPVALDDSAISMTIYEYGNVVQTTRFLKATAFTDTERGAAQAVGQNMAKSLDFTARTKLVGGTMVMYPGSVAARTDLDATNDKISYQFIANLVSMAASMGIPPFEDGTYATIANPALYVDLANMSEWKAVGEYADPKLLYMGKPGVLGKGGRFKNERGMLAGLRFIEHPYGKVWLGGGTVAQTATTVADAAAAGATSIVVTAATGLAAGDWITLGKGTATEEQVQITAVSDTTLTVRGVGNAFGNWGCKYAHAASATVTEAPNVVGLPVFGPKSLRGRFASDPGKNGEVSVEWAATNLPKRAINHSWYWIGGFGVVDKWVVRGECATSGHVLGTNAT